MTFVLPKVRAFRWRGALRDAERPGGHPPPRRTPKHPVVRVCGDTYAAIASYALKHDVPMGAVLDALLADLPLVRSRR